MKTNLDSILQALEKSNNFPKLKCPFCETGHLLVDNSEKILYTNVSTQNFYDVIVDPSVLIQEYSYMLTCDNLECAEKGIVVGKIDKVENGYEGGYDPETGEEYPINQTYKSKYRIDYISIPIKLINLPENIGNELKSCIESSFMLFWVDPNSCANKVRTVIELVMNDIKIPKTIINKNHKRKTYTLHQRIELFQNRKPELGEKLMAIKWIGNFGSHSIDLMTRNDLIDGYEILENVLFNLYNKDSKRIDKLTKIINKIKKPIGHEKENKKV